MVYLDVVTSDFFFFDLCSGKKKKVDGKENCPPPKRSKKPSGQSKKPACNGAGVQESFEYVHEYIVHVPTPAIFFPKTGMMLDCLFLSFCSGKGRKKTERNGPSQKETGGRKPQKKSPCSKGRTSKVCHSYIHVMVLYKNFISEGKNHLCDL